MGTISSMCKDWESSVIQYDNLYYDTSPDYLECFILGIAIYI